MSWPSGRGGELRWLRLSFGHDLDLTQVRQMLLNLLSSPSLGLVVFEIEAAKCSLTYRVGCVNPSQLARILRSHLPTVDVQLCDRSALAGGRTWTLQANRPDRALNVASAEYASAALLGALAVRGSGVLVHQLVVGRRLAPRVIASRASAVSGESPTSRLLNAMVFGERPVDAEHRQALINKQSLPGASVNIRLVGVGDEQQGDSEASRYTAAVRSLETPGLNLRLRKERFSLAAAAMPSRRTVALNVDELLMLLGWPYGDRSYIGVDRDRSVTRRAASSARSTRLLGWSTHPGQEQQTVGLSAVDGLRHTHVLGPTGVGKSTLLLNLILQDVEAQRPVVVVDPKGDLVDDLLARIPKPHLDRVVLLDPSRSDFVVGFNPLTVDPSRHHLAVDNIVHVFKETHKSSWGPRTDSILHASLLTLIGTSQASLVHIPRLLSDVGYRHELLDQRRRSEPLKAFWQWFEDLSQAERSHITAPLLNKIRPLVLRPQLSATLSAPNPLDLSRVFSDDQVLLVALRQGSIGSEVAQLFGSLLFAQLWLAIQSRARLTKSQRRPGFVYADEFQAYTRLPTDFADVLAQSRSFGVGLVLAHQNLDQLNPELRASVEANAQNKIVFRLGAKDAAVMSRQLSDLRVLDLTALPKYEIYAQLLEDAELRPVASVRTVPSVRPLRNSAEVAAALAKKWGTSTVVLEEQEGLEQSQILTDEIGRKPRGAQ